MTDIADISQTLHSHEARLGTERMQRIVTFARSYLTKLEQQLSKALLEQDKEQAKLLAHKAISSAQLYGSPELESLLAKIRDGYYEPEESTRLQVKLVQELGRVNHAMHLWSTRC